MTQSPEYRLIIADDHPLFRDALRGAIEGVLERATIEEAGSFDDLMKCLAARAEADLICSIWRCPAFPAFLASSICARNIPKSRL